jgi:hypothetical protein
MKQDMRSYFVRLDEFGKSEMDYWIERKMDFGKDEELPVAPVPVKAAKTAKTVTKTIVGPKPWAPTIPISHVKSTRPAEKPRTKTHVRSRKSNISAKPKPEKFIREDMRDEILALEMEELALCRDDDYGTAFDLEL